MSMSQMSVSLLVNQSMIQSIYRSVSLQFVIPSFHPYQRADQPNQPATLVKPHVSVRVNKKNQRMTWLILYFLESVLTKDNKPVLFACDKNCSWISWHFLCSSVTDLPRTTLNFLASASSLSSSNNPWAYSYKNITKRNQTFYIRE